MTALEWALATSSAAPSEAGPSRLADFTNSVKDADFRAILFSDEVQSALQRVPNLPLGLRGETVPRKAAADVPTLSSEDQSLLLLAAVALQHAYVQANWTGPDIDFGPTKVLSPAQETRTQDEIAEADAVANDAAVSQLTLLGEPAYHLSTHPALLLMSIRILQALDGQAEPLLTLPWWLLRSHLVHLALLDEAVALGEEKVEAVSQLIESAPDADTKAAIHLELGLLHYHLGQEKQANQAFLDAARASGLEYELTGALGKRTKFQTEMYSQLVLLAESRQRDGEQTSSETPKESSKIPQSLQLNDDTLLEETMFTKVNHEEGSGRLSHLDSTNQPPLHPLDQALLLSLCLAQSNSSPSHGLTQQQMVPFVARVITHPRNWSVHTTALLLRSRLEANRSRTVERSTFQLAALIDQMPTADSEPSERLQYFHELPLPAKWEMERELAKRYLSLGVVRSALEIFTRLEMWEDAVACLQQMERESEAERIVKDLLEGRKIESDVVVSLKREGVSEARREKLSSARAAKLWCLLGDIALASDDASKDPAGVRKIAIGHYEKAWQVSAGSSSRAMRSLGSLYTSSKEWEKAAPCFQKALAINPLFGQAWFTLGVCFMHMQKWTEARDAFRRQVAVDEEDSEGWNNLAAVYLRLNEENVPEGEKPPPVSFENKLLAFRALKSGIRTSFDNWRMWQNYMVVAVDVGQLSEAARAMTRVVEIKAAQDPILAVDPDVLDKLVDSVTRDDWNNGNGPLNGAPPATSNEGWGLLPLVERLFDQTIFPRVSDNPRVWKTHARLQRWKENWEGAIDDYVRAYRVSVVNDEDVERVPARWREAVDEVEELVASLELLGPKVPKQEGKKGGDWRFQARGIVRTFMGRTKDAFDTYPEWERLQTLLDDLKRSD